MKLRKLKKLAQEHHGFGYTHKICSQYAWAYWYNFTSKLTTAKKTVMPKSTITVWKMYQWKR